MKHVTALLIKFVMVALILEIVLVAMTDLTFVDVLYISLAVTIIAYILGDLIILAMSNNTVTTIADAVIAFLTIYLFNYMWTNRHITFTSALVAAVVLGIGEWVYHKYIASSVFPEEKKEKKAHGR